MRRRSVLPIIGTLLLVLSCGHQPDTTPPVDAAVSYGTINGQRVFLASPAKPNGKLIVWVHGRYGHADDPIRERDLEPLRDQLVAAGYMVAGSEAHGNAWGDPASVQDEDDLVGWVRQQHPVGSVVLVGQSMGGLASLLAAPSIPRFAGWIGVYPVCDLSTLNLHRFPEIRTAYAGSDEATRSPVRFGSEWHGRPMLFLASPADTVVPKSSNTDACAAAARRVGAHVEVLTTRGDHGDPSNFDPAPILRWLAQPPV